VVRNSCETALAKASSAVAVAATATANVGGGSGSGDGADPEGSDSAAPSTLPYGPVVTLGNMAVGVYMLVAMAAGAAMVVF
jgi:1,3-beta-glucanosyltransferase GAS1